MTKGNGKFTVCRASAGSGKTFTLVKEYLKIALNGQETAELSNRFTHILAITFTNKAANEMKSRVLNVLKELAEQDIANNQPNKMAEMLMNELNIPPQELKRRCKIVHSSILHKYSEFSISTIDSFTHQIVQTFAHDLNLPINFELQLDQNEIIQESVELLLEKIGTPEFKQITTAAYNYSKTRMEQESSYDIQRKLEKIAPEIFHENADSHLTRLQNTETADYPQIQKQIDKNIKDTTDQLKKAAREIINKTEEKGLTEDDFAGKSKSILTYFQKIADGDINANPNTSNINKFITGESTSNKRATDIAKAAIEELHSEIVSARNTIINLKKQHNTLIATKDNLYCTALLNEINRIIQTYYTENGLIHISEINKKINEVVKQEPIPFIYERIGNHYNNYLIDEFQDNSKLQWQNLIPLVANGLSNNHPSFVVGDGKQSIYRWRGGDVDQFINLPTVDGENKLTFRNHYQPLNLETNYRTGENIIEFNNAFFTWIATQEFHQDNHNLQQLYLGENLHNKDNTPAVHQTPHKKGGYINIDFWEKDNTHEDTYKSIVNQIEAQHHEQGYAYKDITIIARSNKILTDISHILIQHNIPTTSIESFKLSNSISVNIAETALKLITQPENKLYTVQLIKKLEVLHQKDYSEIIKHIQKHQSPNESKKQQQPLSSFILDRIGIPFDLNPLRQLSLYDCCEEIIRIFGLDKTETAYITSFLNTINSYSIRHGSNIVQFLKWFDKKKFKTYAKISQEVDAVKMLTIHKSKGLESPIIIYPITNETNKDQNIWIDFSEGELYDKSTMKTCLFSLSTLRESSLENKVETEELKRQTDRANLLYVALTRPKEKLFIHCESPSKEPSKINTESYFSLLSTFCETELAKLCNTKKIPLSTCTTSEHPNKLKQYTLGEDTNKKETTETGTFQNIELSDIQFKDWQTRLQIARPNNTSAKQQEKIENGIIIHEILSQIHSTDEASSAVEKYCETHHIDNNYKETLKSSIQQMVTSPRTSHFFDKKCDVKCETSIYHNGKELRPDRIIFKKDEILVIDFKTGYAKPGKQMEKYKKQVETYCRAIYEIKQTTTIGYLLFIGQDHPIEVCKITYPENQKP